MYIKYLFNHFLNGHTDNFCSSRMSESQLYFGFDKGLPRSKTYLSCEGEGALLYIFINIKRSGSLILSKYDTNSSPLCACNSGSEF